VSSAAVEIVGNVANARVVIAVDQDLDALESLADGVLGAGEYVDGQVTRMLRRATGSQSRGAAFRNEAKDAG
jgi:hypothetical protein